MFQFLSGETETTHINHIITAGAKTRMTDRQFLEREIAAWRQSPVRKAQITGEKYYAGYHDILLHKRMAIGEDGKLQEVDNLPNFKIVDNQYAKMVDQKVNYLLGKPITFETEDSVYADTLKNVFNNRFYRVFRNLGEDSLNGGIGWLYPYYDEKGALCFKRFESYEILPFWADAEHTVLDAFLRLYEVEAYEGITKKIEEHVEVYTLDGIYRYVLNSGSLVPEPEPFFPYASADGLAYNWEKIPLIPFKYNNKETPLIDRVKSLQDGINLITSTFENNMTEDAHTTVMVLINYDGTDPGEFRRNLATYGVVKIRNTEDSPKGDVKTLTVEVNAENYKAILEIFKKSLIENARGYDAKDDRLSGNPNQMNILSMYSDIDLDANGMETEYQASFEELLWFVNTYFANTGQGDFINTPVTVVFSRNIMMNNTELIGQCKDSVGLVSNKTLLAHHPFVKDVDKELEQLKQEQQEAVDNYANAFPAQQQKQVTGNEEP